MLQGVWERGLYYNTAVGMAGSALGIAWFVRRKGLCYCGRLGGWEILDEARRLLFRRIRSEIRDSRVVEAMERVPREAFVPDESPTPGVRGPPAANRRGPDDLPALHRRADAGGAGAAEVRPGTRGRHRQRLPSGPAGKAGPGCGDGRAYRLAGPRLRGEAQLPGIHERDGRIGRRTGWAGPTARHTTPSWSPRRPRCFPAP